MNLLRTAIKTTRPLRPVNPNQPLRSLCNRSPRHFSSDAEPPTQQQQQRPANPFSFDPFMGNPISTGLVYGRLFGITKHTLKTDVLRVLEECNLSPDDIKLDYNWLYTPIAMMVQFPSRSAFDTAIKAIGKRGRLYRLEQTDRTKWDYLQPYDGKFVLLQGLPPNAQLEDVERFLSGCEFDASSIRMMTKDTRPRSPLSPKNEGTRPVNIEEESPGLLNNKEMSTRALANKDASPGFLRMAIVRFPSSIGAMSAVITKNNNFCLNAKVELQLLQ